MKTMKYISIIMGVLLCAGVAEARIGETPAECDARYGEPAEDQKAENRREYQVGTFSVKCWFHEGKCDAVSYTVMKKSYTTKKSWDAMSALQMMRLLHIYGKDWMPAAGEGNDGDLEGNYQKKDGTLNARLFLGMVTVETAQRTTRGEAAMTKEAIDADISELAK